MTKTLSFEALSAETLPQRLGDTEAAVQPHRRRHQPLESARSRRRQPQSGLHRRGRRRWRRGQAGAALRAARRRQLAAAAEAFLLRISRADPPEGAGAVVPEIFHFDEAQALIVMEYLSPHIILRKALIEGRQLPKIAQRSRAVHGAHAVPWLRPSHEGARPQGRPRFVRRQCRALRHHRKPGLHRSVFRSANEPPHLAAT